MRLAHLADAHLGFRQYHRLTGQGVNQREADIALAFSRALDDVIAEAPDVVVFAGDLFHSVRPTNPAILHSFNQLRRLREKLPAVPLVIVAGNHDTPRSVETGSILRLFEAVEGVHVVLQEPRELRFAELDLSLFCVPHAALASGARPRLVPASDAGRNVLVTHGEVAGIFRPGAAALEYGGAIVERSELHVDEWDYVALGHYHVAHDVAANAWYSGALDYVSSNPWGELKDEDAVGRRGQKGWLLVDLSDDVVVDFRPVRLARRFIDLEPIYASGSGAAVINSLLSERVAAVESGIEGQVVRQVVHDIPTPVARDLDYTLIRELKATALHYYLDLRRPRHRREVGVAAPGARHTLAEVLTDYLSRRPGGAAGVRDPHLALGRAYMDRVEQDLLEG
ncbi:MAG: exonuclease SbcCD subunit D [Gemmatimonadales bacterium]